MAPEVERVMVADPVVEPDLRTIGFGEKDAVASCGRSRALR